MRAEASLRHFFISESRANRIVSLNHRNEFATRPPAAALLHLGQVRDASAFAERLLNMARQVNDKSYVELDSVMTVHDWNVVVASAVTEEIEAMRRGEPALLSVRAGSPRSGRSCPERSRRT
jgi:hypothetical protein